MNTLDKWNDHLSPCIHLPIHSGTLGHTGAHTMQQAENDIPRCPQSLQISYLVMSAGLLQHRSQKTTFKENESLAIFLNPKDNTKYVLTRLQRSITLVCWEMNICLLLTYESMYTYAFTQICFSVSLLYHLKLLISHILVFKISRTNF